jgi:hypothetical protein
MRRKAMRAGLVALMSVAMLLGTIAVASAQSQFGGNEGCTPGYWKNHTDNWPGSNPSDDDYGNLSVTYPGKTIGEILGTQALADAGLSAYADVTLYEALYLKGGPGVSGAAQIEFRAMAAAWLNAADDRINYLYRRNADTSSLLSIRTMVLNSLGDRDAMLEVASMLDAANNGAGGCPLN